MPAARIAIIVLATWNCTEGVNAKLYLQGLAHEPATHQRYAWKGDEYVIIGIRHPFRKNQQGYARYVFFELQRNGAILAARLPIMVLSALLP